MSTEPGNARFYNGNLNSCGAATLDEYFERNGALWHYLRTEYVGPPGRGAWVCLYVIWWPLEALSGKLEDRIIGERLIRTPSCEERDAGVQHLTRKLAEEAVWLKIQQFDCAASFDPKRDWRRIRTTGPSVLIGTIANDPDSIAKMAKEIVKIAQDETKRSEN